MRSVRIRRLIVCLAVLAVVAVTGCGLALPGLAGYSHSQAITANAAPRVESGPSTTQSTVPAMYGSASTPVGAADRAALSLQDELTALYKSANASVVLISVSGGSGSGFVYDSSGHIVTNHHVTSAGGPYEVVFADGARLRAKLVGSDADSDLAVLKVDRLPEGVEPLPLADPEGIQVGQFAVAIGSPFGVEGSMSLGIVSGLGRSLRSQRGRTSGSTYSLPEVIQTDAPINPGNSGGPLLNLDGEVIGVNAAIASSTGTNSGVGFSIPVAAVRLVVPNLIEKGKYAYPYMGASFADEISLDDQEAYGLSQTAGAYVVSVSPGSPAERAGLVAANAQTGRGGDLITEIDGQAILDFSDLNGYLVFHVKVGQTIQIIALRDGRHVELSLTLGARP